MGSKVLTTVFKAVIYFFAVIGFILVAGYFAVRFGLTNQSGIIDAQSEAFLHAPATAALSTYIPLWADTEEWQVLSDALKRDASVLTSAAQDAGVPARLIAANLITEQLRLFFTEREFYKQFFSPLKILGAQSQFSWGVMGIKPATAKAVEANLVDPSSPRYLGPKFEHMLDFSTVDHEAERYGRLTDQRNHYWSYLYAGLYLRQIEAEWRTAGYPIESNVAILSTLYNIGFEHSSPKPDPQIGGAELTISGTTYSFGSLASDFYNSNLLIDVFPR